MEAKYDEKTLRWVKADGTPFEEDESTKSLPPIRRSIALSPLNEQHQDDEKKTEYNSKSFSKRVFNESPFNEIQRSSSNVLFSRPSPMNTRLISSQISPSSIETQNNNPFKNDDHESNHNNKNIENNHNGDDVTNQINNQSCSNNIDNIQRANNVEINKTNQNVNENDNNEKNDNSNNNKCSTLISTLQSVAETPFIHSDETTSIIAKTVTIETPIVLNERSNNDIFTQIQLLTNENENLKKQLYEIQQKSLQINAMSEEEDENNLNSQLDLFEKCLMDKLDQNHQILHTVHNWTHELPDHLEESQKFALNNSDNKEFKIQFSFGYLFSLFAIGIFFLITALPIHKPEFQFENLSFIINYRNFDFPWLSN